MLKMFKILLPLKKKILIAIYMQFHEYNFGFGCFQIEAHKYIYGQLMKQ